ncbi:hypothetical protein [Bacillus toyonensis]|uniref:hypothetical protein n=1 Tax=Bacillus toyonensis TaxID=155322 RepID=UPI000BFCE938|nr:hypothetical protein [Bacillus toyonensis]PHA72676.1 hypothetical protein COE72_14145 [Bacillus toyonensis]
MAVIEDESEAYKVYEQAKKDYPNKGSKVELVKVIESTDNNKLKPYKSNLLKRFARDESTGGTRGDS